MLYSLPNELKPITVGDSNDSSNALLNPNNIGINYLCCGEVRVRYDSESDSLAALAYMPASHDVLLH